jgi:hypothetical protein
MARQRNRKGKKPRRHARQLKFESLEARRLLAAAPATTTVVETITYPQLSSQGAPTEAFVRGAAVIVFDGTTPLNPQVLGVPAGSPDYLKYAPYYTNNLGQVTVTIVPAPDNGSGTVNLTFEVFTISSPSNSSGQYLVSAPPTVPGQNSPAYKATLVAHDVAVTNDMTTTLNAAPVESDGTLQDTDVSAFAVFDALTTASLFTDDLINEPGGLPGSFKTLTVQYPATVDMNENPVTTSIYFGNTPQFPNTAPVIYVPYTDAYDYDVIAHEYGHYVANSCGFWLTNGLGVTRHEWSLRAYPRTFAALKATIAN